MFFEELYVILHDNFRKMKKLLVIISFVCLLSGCASEFNSMYKTSDNSLKYEYAKQLFAEGKYSRAAVLLTDLINVLKGTENGQECLYMLGMSQYNSKDYESASYTFKKYYQSYPRGTFAENAKFYVGKSLYMGTPEPRLDQTQTVNSIAALQEYMDLFPDAQRKEEAQQIMFELQDKLVKKEFYNARLYYNLGTYFSNCLFGGSNYEACIITAQNALKDYPYSSLREEFSVLIMKSKFELAQQSTESKKLDRYRDAEDECYGFINQYPDSKEVITAEKYIERCKKALANSPLM